MYNNPWGFSPLSRPHQDEFAMGFRGYPNNRDHLMLMMSNLARRPTRESHQQHSAPKPDWHKQASDFYASQTANMPDPDKDYELRIWRENGEIKTSVDIHDGDTDGG